MEKKNLTHAELAQEILNYVGGNENIISFMSCMTRLRIEIVDKEKVNIDAIKELDKVKGVQMTGTYCQIILFAELEKVYIEFEKIVKSDGTTAVKAKRSVIDSV